MLAAQAGYECENVNLTIDEYAGKKIVSFTGIPVRRADAILNTESAVTA